MVTSLDHAARVGPRLLPRECGGWLAISPSWARFSVGVAGATEEESKNRFQSTFSRWVSLVDDTVQENT
jgi:hypothetical protein